MTALQVIPDMIEGGTLAELEKAYKVTGHGPGMYLEQERTIMLLRTDDSEKDRDKVWWHSPNDPTTQYMVYVWNCPFEATIFSRSCIAPTRADDR